MKVLVTGAAGFLGSHLCDYLLVRGHSVVGVDNLVTGSKNNLEQALRNKNFTFLEKDICQALPDEEFHWIFNSASLASPVHYYKHPIETLLVGSQGLYNCLELARRCGARVVQFSTSEVYGDPEVHPQVETYWGNVNPVGQRSCYDESKRFGEALCKAFEKTHGLDVRIARIFNTYGPKMAVNDGRLIPELSLQALRGEPLTVFGNGKQTRSFCYVDDMITGLYLMMEKDGLRGEVVNLGNPREFSVLEFAQMIINLTGSKSEIAFKPPLPVWKEDDPKRRKPDISKAEKLINWRPRVELKQGLLLTVKYFKQFC